MNNIEYEKRIWDAIFAKEIQNNNTQKIFSSYWWEDYYQEIGEYITCNVIQKFSHKIDVIEVGSGSGKASLLLGKQVASITLLDISKNALKYAKLLSRKLDVNNVKYICDDMFHTKLQNNTFDFTWNIGTLEHYHVDEIILILKEMLRITKPGGYIAFGIPNKKSGPILKAKFLKLPFLKYIPGYRLDTERFFTDEDIFGFLQYVGVTRDKVQLIKFGSFLPMEAPKFLIKNTKNIFPNNKFLHFYLIKK